MEEIWKLWKEGYEWIGGKGCKRYNEPIFVSNLGNVRGRDVHTNPDGYQTVKYKNKYYKVHRLVAELFIPNPENKPEVDHINRNRNDNRVQNLRWATRSENMKNMKNNKMVINLNTGEISYFIDVVKKYKDGVLSQSIKHGWCYHGSYYDYADNYINAN